MIKPTGFGEKNIVTAEKLSLGENTEKRGVLNGQRGEGQLP